MGLGETHVQMGIGGLHTLAFYSLYIHLQNM